MSDPFESLRHLDEGPPGPALPAAEVRRRGDRMRRRRTALRAVAAGCAVAVVASGGIALGGGLTDSAPPPPVTTQDPSPSPSGPPPDQGTPRTKQALSVPDGFPLLEGLPAEDADTDRTTVRALDTPRIFDPCHDNTDASADNGRTDYRRVVQSGPAYSYQREIVVYESSSAANEAMLVARSELERCPQYAYDDGVSRDIWEPSPVETAGVPADDAIVSVNHGYSDHGLTTLATHWMVMRVGNALVSLAYDGEFGATESQVRAVADSELGAYEALAASMCPFADETTEIGCGEPSTAAGPGEVTDPGPELLLDEADLRAGSQVTELETVPDSRTATLACQEQWLSSLGSDTADYRQFEARGDSGDLGAFAGTAVLGFPSELAAGTAYDTVGEWVSQCEVQVDPTHRLVKAVDGGLGEPHITRLPDGMSFWRAVKLTAPERCVECDAAWDDYQGAVLVGRHLVLVHVALGGDMQSGVDDSRLSLQRLLDLAAERVRDHADDTGTPTISVSTFLGPDGYGPLKLGMTAAEAEASGVVTLEDSHGGGCTTFGLMSPDRQRTVGTGFLSPGKGVVAIFVDKGIETPAGIHVGSGIRAVKRAYTHLTGRVSGLSAPASDGARYVMTFDREKVEELALATADQDCFS